MSLPRYQEYKESGVEWIGSVPTHWTVEPIKRGFSVVGGSTPKSDEAAFWDGEIVWVSPADLSRLPSMHIAGSGRTITEAGLKSCGTTMVPAGSIVLSTRAPIGSLAIAATTLCTNQGCKSLVPGELASSHYFAYVLLSATTPLNLRGKGTTFLELSADELAAFKVPYPTAKEQTAIAAFLDRETAKIDALIAEQEKLIVLLTEKRQATISHAVAKGLNPNAAMKDSGVAWLGEVPAHWEVCFLKTRFASVDYGISDSLAAEGSVAVLRMGNIIDGQVCLDDLKYVDEVDPALLLVRDDLLFNRTNSLALVGKVGLFDGAEQPVSFASYLVRIRVKNNNVASYFSYLLNAPGLLGDVRSRAFEAIGQCNLNPTRYGQMRVAVPPQDEQLQIAAFLKRESTKLHALKNEAERVVSLLKERRAGLIIAAVTGQVDVRGVVSHDSTDRPQAIAA